jgi:tetratricopeptide (TPR) repeat protein
MITQAEEYIVQENYEDGMEQYKEAIRLLPAEPGAYKALAQIYIDRANYKEAILLLKEAGTKTKDSELEEMLLSTAELKVTQEQKEWALTELFKALKERNIDELLSIMRQDEYQTLIKAEEAIFYEAGEGDTTKSNGLIVNKDESLYYGNVINGVKKGAGIYFIKTSNDYGTGYYYYEGEWNNNIPNGAGKTVDVQMLKSEDNGLYEDMTVTTGTFYEAFEDGAMEKYFYINGEETERLSYYTKKGIPMPADQTNPVVTDKSYSLGFLFKGDENTKKEYMVEPGTIFGVKPYIK